MNSNLANSFLEVQQRRSMDGTTGQSMLALEQDRMSPILATNFQYSTSGGMNGGFNGGNIGIVNTFQPNQYNGNFNSVYTGNGAFNQFQHDTGTPTTIIAGHCGGGSGHLAVGPGNATAMDLSWITKNPMYRSELLRLGRMIATWDPTTPEEWTYAWHLFQSSRPQGETTLPFVNAEMMYTFVREIAVNTNGPSSKIVPKHGSPRAAKRSTKNAATIGLTKKTKPSTSPINTSPVDVPVRATKKDGGTSGSAPPSCQPNDAKHSVVVVTPNRPTTIPPMDSCVKKSPQDDNDATADASCRKTLAMDEQSKVTIDQVQPPAFSAQRSTMVSPCADIVDPAPVVPKKQAPKISPASTTATTKTDDVQPAKNDKVVAVTNKPKPRARHIGKSPKKCPARDDSAKPAGLDGKPKRGLPAIPPRATKRLKRPVPQKVVNKDDPLAVSNKDGKMSSFPKDRPREEDKFVLASRYVSHMRRFLMVQKHLTYRMSDLGNNCSKQFEDVRNDSAVTTRRLDQLESKMDILCQTMTKLEGVILKGKQVKK